LGDFPAKFPLRFQSFAHQNPYSTEQGFFSRLTGNYQRRTGNSAGPEKFTQAPAEWPPRMLLLSWPGLSRLVPAIPVNEAAPLPTEMAGESSPHVAIVCLAKTGAQKPALRSAMTRVGGSPVCFDLIKL
jgi:hypothetical protein